MLHASRVRNIHTIVLTMLAAAVGFVLSRVFSGSLILPQYFFLGPLKIHYYGICLALAAAVGYWLAAHRAKRYGIPGNFVDDGIFWIVLCGFAGARLYHVLSSFSFYAAQPAAVFKVWDGGLSIYGAVFGGLLALFFCRKIHNLKSDILHLCNWLTPSLIAGQIIGRFGNLFNYELYGYPTNLPWKMFVPRPFRSSVYQNFQFFHPLFLYEALANLLVFLALLRLEKTGQRRRLFIWYIVLYNAVRFCLEFLRVDSVFIGSFRQNAIVSLALALAAVVLLSRTREHA